MATDAADTSDPFQRLRSLMPALSTWAYLDFAAVAPLPAPVRDVFHAWADDMAQNGATGWGAWRKRVEDTRRSAAAMLGADADEIALVRNTTEGLSLIAEGFPWKPGDNVVVPASEFPSNLFPWRNLESRGVEVRLASTPDERLSIAEIESHCDSRTRVIAVGWVGYATGWRNDLSALAELAHRRGALLCVDAIQGLGVLPLDVRDVPIDFLAADGHKWLLGPEGAGVLFIRREHLDRLRPLGIGWNSVRQAGHFTDSTFDLRRSAARYEGGSYPMAGICALGTAIDLLRDIGAAIIERRLLELTNLLCEHLRAIGASIHSERGRVEGADRRSGIVSFSLPGRDPHAVRGACLSRRVVVNVRGNRLRASPHVMSDENDVSALIDALESS
ncbi:MAG: aminotransferase class V-fold PLP-dependent enzyme [Planctomycetaceae bacterium]|nr:aminotransferase class V-fold PLP-dependent enzyme [Planctomycetaceae bacterium]